MCDAPLTHRVGAYGGYYVQLMARLFFQRNAGLLTIAGTLVVGNVIFAGAAAIFVPSLFWPMFWFGMGFDLMTMWRRRRSA
jgi:hypothetical protein